MKTEKAGQEPRHALDYGTIVRRRRFGNPWRTSHHTLSIKNEALYRDEEFIAKVEEKADEEFARVHATDGEIIYHKNHGRIVRAEVVLELLQPALLTMPVAQVALDAA